MQKTQFFTNITKIIKNHFNTTKIAVIFLLIVFIILLISKKELFTVQLAFIKQLSLIKKYRNMRLYSF